MVDARAVLPDTPTRSRAAVHGPARQGKLLLALAPPRGPASQCPAPQPSRLAWGLHKKPRPSFGFLSVKWGGVYGVRGAGLAIPGQAGEGECGGPDLGASILVSTLCPPIESGSATGGSFVGG